MDALVEQMLGEPDVLIKLETLRGVLDREHERRLRFYEEITPEEKIEFINGEVVWHSPSRLRHSNTIGFLFRLLADHVDQQGLGLVLCEKSMVSLSRNDYEPDVLFFSPEKADAFSQDQLLFPAPDFIAEVLSPSTQRNDRGIKKQDYAAHGVREYWIVDPVKKTIEQYVLTDSTFELRGTWTALETITSTIVPRFCIPVRAVFERESYLAARSESSV